ncbi:GntR family transcriptional regulator [Arcobacter sp. YIC-80]|uniref:GntR family transcriptional regulator n=1 Tax=unclassified Arcobacter TaxID=2593671 RepID=UPI00384F11BE
MKEKKIRRSKTQTITEQVYKQLEQMIVFCEIEPGSVLTEKEICDMLGAGRTPVHEALLLLSKRFLVNFSKLGIMIPDMNSSIQLQLLEMRRPILKTCVECAIKRLTQVDKDNIAELLDSVDDLTEPEFLNWLEKRQEVLSKASKNFFIYEELRNVQGLSRRFWYYYSKKEDNDVVRELHKKILKAVHDENEKDAVKYVDEIIDYIENFVKKNSI